MQPRDYWGKGEFRWCITWRIYHKNSDLQSLAWHVPAGYMACYHKDPQ